MSNTVPKGSLVEIVDGRFRKLGGHIDALVVTDLDYLHEVLDKIERWWNMDFYSGMNGEIDRGFGRTGCERTVIPVKALGLYLGSLNVYDPNFLGRKETRVYRAVLLEKSVYIVPANCVKWVQGVRKPQKAANDG